MKLNEVMKYPGQTIGGFWKKTGYAWFYILYDTKKAGLAIADDWAEAEDFIIGGLGIGQITNDTHPAGEEWKIGSVAAESGYGPILYYIAMATHGYVRSDLNVSTDAQHIWNTFSSLEKQGKNIKKKPSYKESSMSYGPAFKFAYTVTGPLRIKIIDLMRKAKINHQNFLNDMSELREFNKPLSTKRIESYISSGAHSYVNSQL